MRLTFQKDDVTCSDVEEMEVLEEIREKERKVEAQPSHKRFSEEEDSDEPRSHSLSPSPSPTPIPTPSHSQSHGIEVARINWETENYTNRGEQERKCEGEGEGEGYKGGVGGEGDTEGSALGVVASLGEGLVISSPKEWPLLSPLPVRLLFDWANAPTSTGVPQCLPDDIEITVREPDHLGDEDQDEAGAETELRLCPLKRLHQPAGSSQRAAYRCYLSGTYNSYFTFSLLNLRTCFQETTNKECLHYVTLYNKGAHVTCDAPAFIRLRIQLTYSDSTQIIFSPRISILGRYSLTIIFWLLTSLKPPAITLTLTIT